MNKKIIIIIVLVIIGVGAVFLLSRTPAQNPISKAENSSDRTDQEQKVETVKVYYFHNNARCASCRTLEKYTKQTIEEFFQPELRDGKVEFRSINVDSAKNKELARKYKASGSSLFINRIIKGQDNIEQDTRIWRLLNNETEFKNYLKNKIDSYLN